MLDIELWKMKRKTSQSVQNFGWRVIDSTNGHSLLPDKEMAQIRRMYDFYDFLSNSMIRNRSNCSTVENSDFGGKLL